MNPQATSEKKLRNCSQNKIPPRLVWGFFNEVHLTVHEACFVETHEAGRCPTNRASGSWGIHVPPQLAGGFSHCDSVL